MLREILTLKSNGCLTPSKPMERIPNKPFPPFCVILMMRAGIDNNMDTTQIDMGKEMWLHFDEDDKYQQVYSFTSAVVGYPGHFWCMSRVLRNKAWEWYECNKNRVKKCKNSDAQKMVETRGVILIFHNCGRVETRDAKDRRARDAAREKIVNELDSVGVDPDWNVVIY